MTEQVANSPLVLDTATMDKALTRLSKEANTGLPWGPATNSPNTASQQRFLNGYYRNMDAVEALSGLKVEGSRQADVLNQFLVDNGFKPMFREISPGGVGACAILDLLVKWAVTASVTKFNTYINGTRQQHKAFELPIGGAEVFSVSSTGNQLAKLSTKDGGAFWLLITDRPEHGLDLGETAVSALATRQPVDTTWISSVVVPMIDIDTEVPLDWMLGVSSGNHYIDQAFQLFKLRINDKGGRFKIATGFTTTRGGPRLPEPLVFDRPFTGWFTQPGSEIPIAPFYADESTWKDGGSLDDM